MTHSGNPFGQVLVALVTPMTADGEVDWPAVEKHIDGVIAAGADGIVVTGTTGETSTLTDAEKIRLVEVGQGCRGRPRPHHHRWRLQRDRPRDRAVQGQREGRGGRHHDRHPVLQQAHAGGHAHALPARRRRHRSARDPLRHPRAHGRADQVRDDPAHREAPERPRHQGRQGRLQRGQPGAQPDRPDVLLRRRRQRAAAPVDRRDRAHRRHREHRRGARIARSSTRSTAATWQRRPPSTSGSSRSSGRS